MTEPEITTRMVDGASLLVRWKGQGRPLVYFHDELSGAWNRFLDILAERWLVLAPDLPGFGDSERPDWVETVPDLAFFLADVLESLVADGPALLVGASLGGWLAVEAALRAGDGVGRLVLIGAPGLEVSGDPPADYFFMTPDERTSLFFNDASSAPAVDEEARIRNEMMTARLVWQPRYVSPKLDRLLHRVRVPAQVLWGADDRFLSVACGQAYAHLLPEAEMTLVQGSGHFPVLERPVETARAVTTFLSRHDGAG